MTLVRAAEDCLRRFSELRSCVDYEHSFVHVSLDFADFDLSLVSKKAAVFPRCSCGRARHLQLLSSAAGEKMV